MNSTKSEASPSSQPGIRLEPPHRCSNFGARRRDGRAVARPRAAGSGARGRRPQPSRCCRSIARRRDRTLEPRCGSPSVRVPPNAKPASGLKPSMHLSAQIYEEPDIRPGVVRGERADQRSDCLRRSCRLAPVYETARRPIEVSIPGEDAEHSYLRLSEVDRESGKDRRDQEEDHSADRHHEQ